jgi:hypothetical protein
MLLRIAKAILLLCFLFNTAAASGLSSDLALLRLVPPESEIIASMLQSPTRGQQGSFLLITGNNRIDFQDFLAIAGADPSRSIRQVVFLAAPGEKGILSEHSLLASGHFNRDAIFRFGDNRNARMESYRGIPVLVVPAFERERGTFNELRWLSILDSNVADSSIAVFGTMESVERELDRYLAKSEPDPLLMERLSRLGREDETWCLLPAPREGGVIQSALEKLDAELGAVANEGGPLEFGIHFGRRVEITASSAVVSLTSPNLQLGALGEQSRAASYFLPSSGDEGDGTLKRTVVKVSRRRYEEWLSGFSLRGLTIGGSAAN